MHRIGRLADRWTMSTMTLAQVEKASLLFNDTLITYTALRLLYIRTSGRQQILRLLTRLIGTRTATKSDKSPLYEARKRRRYCLLLCLAAGGAAADLL